MTEPTSPSRIRRLSQLLFGGPVRPVHFGSAPAATASSTSAAALAPSSASPATSAPDPAEMPVKKDKPDTPAPYDTPPADGTCWLLQLPEELIEAVALQLDWTEVGKCLRLCKTIQSILSESSALKLKVTLAANHLRLNPHALAPPPIASGQPPITSAALLSTLRERLTRFRNLRPSRTSRVHFSEPDGRLYEYLEGVLLRGVGDRHAQPREIAVYDLRADDDWEDVDEEPEAAGGRASASGARRGAAAAAEAAAQPGDVEMEEIDEAQLSRDREQQTKRTHKFKFQIADFAVDPGQDLLVVAELRLVNPRMSRLYFHLLSLATFKPHPLATVPILMWPEPIAARHISLGFQICDDGFYALHHNVRTGSKDKLYGWQWTTGRLATSIISFGTWNFESMILLTPSALVIPAIHAQLDPDSPVHGELDNPIDLLFTHHLLLYAFPPLSELASTPAHPTPRATHVATIDLPRFRVDLAANIPPPRMGVRCDPPPRQMPPKHPVGAPAAFLPDPASGIVTLELQCQMNWEPEPHYMMIMLKSTLTRYLPPPMSQLLRETWSRPVPVIPWDMIAPDVRVFGPDLESSGWVCYVYHHYWVAMRCDHTGEGWLQIFDFDPLRIRKEVRDRFEEDCEEAELPPEDERSPMDVEGDVNGRRLIVSETIHPVDPDEPGVLLDEIRVGSRLPMVLADRPTDADVALIDAERIVLVHRAEGPLLEGGPGAELEIWEF